MEKTQITVIGSGVIGLAVAYILSDSFSDITVIEKNRSFGEETSSRNSEVIHAGLYYPKSSLKAKTCIRGKNLLYGISLRHNIPHKKLGKLILAKGKDDIDKIKEIEKNASSCSVDNLKFLEKNDIKKIEKNIDCEYALFSPDSGIIDSHALMVFLQNSAKANHVDFVYSVKVIDIKKKASSYEIKVKEPKGEDFTFETNFVINSAGLESDKIASMVGIPVDKTGYRIHYSKGEYFRIKDPKKFNIKHLIYPPPTKSDLGIHITPDLGGGLRLGPDAKYVEKIEYSVPEEGGKAFLDSIKKFLPNLKLDDIMPDTAGVRPKLQKEEEDFRDFVISEESNKGFPNFINLIGIESPGLTSSIAIAEIVKGMLKNA